MTSDRHHCPDNTPRLDRPKSAKYLIVMGVRYNNGTFREREQAYRRRLSVFLPISAAIVLFLFLTSDRVSITEIDKRVGWKGVIRVLPEITVVPDDDPHTSIERQRELTTMTSVDIDLFENPDINKPRFVNVERPEEVEILDFAEHDLYDVRTAALRKQASFSDRYVILKMVEPKYPPRELSEGIEGNVTVELLVNEQGLVEKVTVLSKIGPKSFEESTLEALKQFVFQPLIENGEPVAMWVKFLVKFRIFG
jgi:TonB family protein